MYKTNYNKTTIKFKLKKFSPNSILELVIEYDFISTEPFMSTDSEPLQVPMAIW